MMSDKNAPPLTAQMILRAYAIGVFPMADDAQSEELFWYDPPVRALIPLDHRFHVSKRLARTVKQSPYRVTVDKAFEAIMKGCAEPKEGRERTWINQEILSLYTELHNTDSAHSIEVWEDDQLQGGLYGVSLGGAFFGESMFSRKKDTSKIALVHLVALLRHHGYALLDAQFQTANLQRYGTFEVPRSTYLSMLDTAMKAKTTPFASEPDWPQLLAEGLSLQPVTQRS